MRHVPDVLPPSSVSVIEAIRALAFVGDLSMGQPVDHSMRTAWLAAQLAQARGASKEDADESICVALLRWSGCTANAPEFGAMLGDDVTGRDAMLTTLSMPDLTRFAGALEDIARIHCEVSGQIAATLGLPDGVERALRHIFESFSGRGLPDGLAGSEVPPAVYDVTLAGDLEILTRAHGLSEALRQMQARGDQRYPASLVSLALAQAEPWMAALRDGVHEREPETVSAALAQVEAPLALIADVIDLKLPWMTGFSRRVAETAREAAAVLGLDPATRTTIHRAGLIHGIGRASVPNALWSDTGHRNEAELERLRLAPYWTGRAGRRLSALTEAVELASYADERLDGSGAFRGVRGDAISRPARVLAASAACVQLMTATPGRQALSADQAREALRAEVAAGRLDGDAVEAVCGRQEPRSAVLSPARDAATPLSSREIEVLARVAVGESNKEAALVLGISPSTVRTHLESAFRKLGCSTRAAATLKAMTLGVLRI